MIYLGDITVNWREHGARDGAPVVFAHPLGLDLRVWDALMPLLPQDLRLIRYDLRGHGSTTCPAPPYAMGTLIHDAERLLDALGIKECTFVGLSIGGMIAQGLAVKRLDLVRGLVLSNTAAKIGTEETWARRIASVQKGGIEAIADDVLDRWFGCRRCKGPEAALTREILESQLVNGYAGCAAAIAGTDFMTPTSGLRLPALVVAGASDGSTPPDLVRELADLIPGARFALMRGVGHLPCIDNPPAYAALLTEFLESIGHA